MIYNKMEIYPYKNRKKQHTSKLDLNYKSKDNINNIDFVNKLYLKMLNPNAEKSNTIITEIMAKIINVTKSKDAFIGFIDKKIFKYYYIYLDIGGITFKSDMEPCSIEITHNNLLARGINHKKNIVCNEYSTDPRKSNKNLKNIKAHPDIRTFLGIPLIKNS